MDISNMPDLTLEAKVIATAASQTGLAILLRPARGPATQLELAEAAGLGSRDAAMYHVRNLMVEPALVKETKHGRVFHYTLISSRIAKAEQTLRGLGAGGGATTSLTSEERRRGRELAEDVAGRLPVLWALGHFKADARTVETIGERLRLDPAVAEQELRRIVRSGLGQAHYHLNGEALTPLRRLLAEIVSMASGR